MKTFLVPTDFSDTARNAAMFAAGLSAYVENSRIILYHVYPEIFAGSDSSPLNDEAGARQKIFQVGLSSVRDDMQALTKATITGVAEENNSFVNSLQDFVAKENVDLIIMGITGSSKIEQVLIGSNALHIVNKNICPVMIIPPSASFASISNVAFATDFKDIENSTAIAHIQSVLSLFKAKIHMVNVSEDPAHLTAEDEKQRNKLEEVFGSFNPQFHLMKSSNVVETIDKFVTDNYIDVIITVPRKHFLNGIFQGTHTRRLVYHSHIPVVAIHE